MMRGDFIHLFEQKLMNCLMRLGCNIQIEVQHAKAEIEHLLLVSALAGHHLRVTC
jgi:hypothetical protein